MVLTRNGELLLNQDLFPYLIRFLCDEHIQDVVSKGDMTVKSWHAVCLLYLSFLPPNIPDPSIPIDFQSLLDYLEDCEGSNIPIGCNCIRVLFPREWNIGFGPYPTSCYSIINKHNDQRHIISLFSGIEWILHFYTPTSIKQFPLSLLRNLSGLYLINPKQRSGTIVRIWSPIHFRSTDQVLKRFIAWMLSVNIYEELWILNALIIVGNLEWLEWLIVMNSLHRYLWWAELIWSWFGRGTSSRDPS